MSVTLELAGMQGAPTGYGYRDRLLHNNSSGSVETNSNDSGSEQGKSTSVSPVSDTLSPHHDPHQQYQQDKQIYNLLHSNILQHQHQHSMPSATAFGMEVEVIND